MRTPTRCDDAQISGVSAGPAPTPTPNSLGGLAGRPGGVRQPQADFLGSRLRGCAARNPEILTHGDKS